MDPFHLMKVFVAVGELEGFAAAARRLGISPAAVTRAVSALETRLGVKLVQRTTRSVRVTEAGRRYLDDSRAILASLVEADEAAAGVNASLKGTLSITAPVLFGRTYVMPCIVDFLQAHPEVDVCAFFLDRLVNVVEEGMDVAVRIGHLPDSGLRALRVGQVRRVLCASPGYLAQHGTPRRPADLASHVLIASSSAGSGAVWRFSESGEPVALRIKPRLSVTSNDGAIAAACAGLGIAQQMSYQVADQIAQGALTVVLEAFEESPWPIHVLHRESRHGSVKVRTFIDHLAAHLRCHRYLN
ncbi:LysR family transcriptional regulator [Pseudomonas sp. S75]|uniref:LysR family transcriptional regulator n=1 Tax=unclassified Pseudomonas TaxID=196821 RepID=UPI0019061AD7|nr:MULTISPECIES: LysR family transcriptional regulator [unclassified Pseudomonas]MBJ9977204.1 LysR family transcriptional regulator [Pseudomonas sp. S30]MBK0154206.1 LysR family transcriptional regulator [Pseudomonas sp. S75]